MSPTFLILVIWVLFLYFFFFQRDTILCVRSVVCAVLFCFALLSFFSLYFLVNLAKGLSTMSNFSKNQLLVSWFFFSLLMLYDIYLYFFFPSRELVLALLFFWDFFLFFFKVLIHMINQDLFLHSFVFPFVPCFIKT